MAEIKEARRCGNTTRQIDEEIQTLFEKGQVYVVDHHISNQSNTNRSMKVMHIERIAKRLIGEHRMIYGKDFMIKENEGFIFLSPDTIKRTRPILLTTEIKSL